MGRFERGLRRARHPEVMVAEPTDRTDDEGHQVLVGLTSDGVTDIGTISVDELGEMDGLT